MKYSICEIFGLLYCCKIVNLVGLPLTVAIVVLGPVHLLTSGPSVTPHIRFPK